MQNQAESTEPLNPNEQANENNPSEQARSELQDYLAASALRRQVFPRAALVGLAAGAVAVIFRWLLAGGDAVRAALLTWAHTMPMIGWVFPMLFGALGAVAAVYLVRRYAPEASGSGIPHLEAVLHRLRTFDWRRVLPVKLAGGTLAIGAGMVLGREGPTVQMGGAAGDAVASLLKSPAQERRTLMAAGAGAGLAAAFNAPLSGVMFVLEEVQRDFRPIVLGAAFVAAAVADILARLAAGQQPVFSVPAYPMAPLAALPAFAALGVAAGGLGVVFNRVLLRTLDMSALLQGRGRGAGLLYAAIVGALVGLVAWFTPMGVGGGHTLTELVLEGNLALAALPLWFLLRFALTMGSYSTGAPGGIFAPLLVLGALLGLAVGQLAHMVAPEAVPQPGVFAVVGMAAYFTGIVRAPLTGIVLIMEMTGSYSQMLPLLVSCFCAYAVAEYLRDLPVYEALLERDLRRGGSATPHRQPVVIEREVEPGSPFAGRQIRDLGLPPGCIIVRCVEDGREHVPTARTRLVPHMRITAVVGSEAEGGVAALRHGCEA